MRIETNRPDPFGAALQGNANAAHADRPVAVWLGNLIHKASASLQAFIGDRAPWLGVRRPAAAAPALPARTQTQQPLEAPCSTDGTVDWLQPPLPRGDGLAGLRAIHDASGPQVLGAGGQATVITLRAERDRPVAAKIMKTSVGGSPADKLRQARRMVERELSGFRQYYARTPARDPNLVDVYGSANITLNGVVQPVLLMEQVKGPGGVRFFKALHDMRIDGRIDGEQFAAAVQFMIRRLLELQVRLEDAGILHCDFKLDNLAIDRDTLEPRVFDFGSWVPPGGSHRHGTPGLRAPEVRHGMPFTGQTDVFALGATLMDMVEHPNTIDKPGKGLLQRPRYPVWGTWKVDHRGALFRNGARPQPTTHDGAYAELVNGMLARGKAGNSAIRKAKQKPSVGFVYKLLSMNNPHTRQWLEAGARFDAHNRRATVSAAMRENRINAAQALAKPYIKNPAMAEEDAKQIVRKVLEYIG